MRHTVRAALGGTAVALGLLSVQLPASATPPPGEDPAAIEAHGGDELPNPLGDERREARSEALQGVLAGSLKPVDKGKSKTVKLPKGQYVELAREATDDVFVVLSEFGDKVDPRYGAKSGPGPLHNQIPQPDRATNNSTIWQPDYNRAHYDRLYFDTTPGADSVANYYVAQSSNRYSIKGSVADWVKLDYNAARYGSNLNQAETYWAFVKDSVNRWYETQLAAGRSKADVVAELKANDKWDRYDHDNDGNFNEADGYIDHMQLVHAGVGEETGGGQQGTDAIWSHRWYAFNRDIGRTGPSTGPKYGGTQIGDSDVWVGDYTVQPENGGLGVFAHEYGHDLGLPDHYDTRGGENGTGFWTLMSSGSYLSRGGEDIGSRPGDLSGWDKLQLGWLDYELVKPGESRKLQLGVAEYNSKKPQAVVVQLPAKTVSGVAYNHYYIAENRQYVSYDETLRTGPYNFGFRNTRPNWVERYPYQNGLLISYWDTSQRDNNTSVHPGKARIMPVDSHPVPDTWADGNLMAGRIQVRDATFGVEDTEPVTLHRLSVPTTIGAKPATEVFDDRNKFWYPEAGPAAAWAGLDLPKTGTTISVESQASGGKFLQVEVQAGR